MAKNSVDFEWDSLHRNCKINTPVFIGVEQVRKY